MFSLEANKNDIYYSLFAGETDILDSQGYRTGEKSFSYEPPVKTRLLFRESGVATFGDLGIDTKYDLTLISDNMNCPITEGTQVWYKKVPSGIATDKGNYVVVKKIVGLNNITYGLKQL